MIDLKQKYGASIVAVMRQALSEVVADRRFLVRKSVTPLEVAEHILQQAASGERDLNRLKSSAFKRGERDEVPATPLPEVRAVKCRCERLSMAFFRTSALRTSANRG